jgi:hypothetical protein
VLSAATAASLSSSAHSITGREPARPRTRKLRQHC